ncbi:sigma-70 family RNA polymerase sigma factor [Streptomyces sp. NPDC047971]|uniref:sigma-70 family RNA polymerase sigma factor n=1 Tax=Streptomyces sp. NPDC047971 TaxID=3154499 RepID=UPI0033E98C78
MHRPADELTDEEIGAGLVRGDEHCLVLAYRRWGGLVHTLASRTIGDPREAEDVTQQVFLAAWRGHRSYRPERGPVPAWLVGIARRKIADALSARTRRTALIAAAGAALPPSTATADGPDHVLDRVVVAGELARLPGAQRDVLTLAYFGDLTQAQIARRTGLPLGTVKSHARRGMQRLRCRLAPDAGDDLPDGEATPTRTAVPDSVDACGERAPIRTADRTESHPWKPTDKRGNR